MVYDLRQDPTNWLTMTPAQLAEAQKWKKDSTEPRLPVKLLQFNHCPAVAPLSVLDEASQKRLGLDLAALKKHQAILQKDKQLADKLCTAAEILDKQQQSQLFSDQKDVDGQLYDGFFEGPDKQSMSVVRAADPQELGSLNLAFQDKRLEALLPLYKARNYPKLLSSDERAAWEEFRTKKLLSGGQSSRLAKYMGRLQAIVSAGGLTGHQEYLLEELRLYAESIVPEP